MRVIRHLGVAVAVAVAAIVAAAPAASAHAVLLRTDPAPQTTVKKAPSVIRLDFSESVEVSFGAIRVFDVDANRVDSGGLKRAQGGREVQVPVRHLKDGTYTVTWRVVSADGHPVHGGFGFFVGAPSTISPKAVQEEAGAGRLVGWGFGVVRFAWFAALLGLIGAAVVRRWVWTPAVATVGGGTAVGEDDDLAVAAEGFRGRFRRLFPALWAVLFVAGALTIVFEASSVTALKPWSVLARASVLRDALHTAYGRYWLWQMAITVVALVPVWALVRRRRLWRVPPRIWLALFGAAAGGLCFVAALNGHARTLGHPDLGVASVALHLASVGVWAGGLAALVVLAGRSWRALPADRRAPLLRELVPRFSRIAVAAVLVVVATGVVNALLDLASVSDLWRDDYGRVVLAKVAVLLLALVLAARHLWVVPRRLADPASGRRSAASFARTSGVELALLGGAVALAAGLVALVPGKTLALAANGPVNKQRAAGGYTVQLYLDPSTVGANQVHVTFQNAQGLGATEVTQLKLAIAPGASPLQPVDMRLISAGHFAGDTTLARPGSYRVTVDGGGQGVKASTTFTFKLSKKGT
jgi:copper transport protein